MSFYKPEPLLNLEQNLTLKEIYTLARAEKCDIGWGGLIPFFKNVKELYLCKDTLYKDEFYFNYFAKHLDDMNVHKTDAEWLFERYTRLKISIRYTRKFAEEQFYESEDNSSPMFNHIVPLQRKVVYLQAKLKNPPKSDSDKKLIEVEKNFENFKEETAIKLQNFTDDLRQKTQIIIDYKKQLEREMTDKTTCQAELREFRGKDKLEVKDLTLKLKESQDLNTQLETKIENLNSIITELRLKISDDAKEIEKLNFEVKNLNFGNIREDVFYLRSKIVELEKLVNKLQTEKIEIKAQAELYFSEIDKYILSNRKDDDNGDNTGNFSPINYSVFQKQMTDMKADLLSEISQINLSIVKFDEMSLNFKNRLEILDEENNKNLRSLDYITNESIPACNKLHAMNTAQESINNKFKTDILAKQKKIKSKLKLLSSEYTKLKLGDDDPVIKKIFSDILTLNNTISQLSKQEEYQKLFEEQNKKIQFLEITFHNYKSELNSELKDLTAVKNLTIEMEDQLSKQNLRLEELDKVKVERLNSTHAQFTKEMLEIKKAITDQYSKIEGFGNQKIITDLNNKLNSMGKEFDDFKIRVEIIKKDSDFICKKVFEDCEQNQIDLLKNYEDLKNLIDRSLIEKFLPYKADFLALEKEKQRSDQLIKDEIELKLSDCYLRMDVFMAKYANAFGKLPNIENEIISLKTKIYNESFINELKERPLIHKIDKMIERKFNREHLRLKNNNPKPYFVENIGSLSATDQRLAKAWNDFAKKTSGTNKNTYLDPTRVMHYDERMSEDEWSWQKNINRGLTAHIDTSYLFKQNLLVKCV